MLTHRPSRALPAAPLCAVPKWRRRISTTDSQIRTTDAQLLELLRHHASAVRRS
jgi:hypothetical protein